MPLTGLKALNIGSGLNNTQIVDAIVNARRVPREKIINSNITERETQTSSFSEIKGALSTFRTKWPYMKASTASRLTATVQR